MSLLNRSTRSARAIYWIFALLATSLMGCVWFEALDPGAKPFAFSHKFHVVDQGLNCTSCHRNADKADEPGMPSASQCALCHDEADSAKPPERRVASLFEGKKYKAQHVMALGGEVVFSHKSHATRGQECSTCHADIAANDVLTPALAPSMDSCTACHAKTGAANTCDVCHNEIRADLAPPNHRTNWKRLHGEIVRECKRDTASRCEMCHKESGCTACHQTELPDNHNGFWRRRGHGLAASMDRQNCATCHQASSCDLCHQETKPQNHTSGFGSPNDRHCMSCHQPLGNESCVVCHKSTPSHALATPKPPDHNPAMNCRLCHGNGQPLPHFDNGDNCNSCHQ